MIKHIKTITALLLCLSILFLSGCTSVKEVYLPTNSDYISDNSEIQKTELKVGVVKGPYGELFMDTIEPALRNHGYTVEIVTYENYSEPNYALVDKDIDLNLFQNYKYLNSFKQSHNAELTAITEMPTLSMGVYSNKYEKLEDIESGATIAIPKDATNSSRALILLETANLISIKPTVEESRAKIGDIVGNPKNLKFVSFEASELASQLEVYDAAIITGNYASAAGIDANSTLYTEHLTEGYLNVLVTRTEDLSQDYIDIIIEHTHSEEFKAFFMNSDSKYRGYQWPNAFLDNRLGGA